MIVDLDGQVTPRLAQLLARSGFRARAVGKDTAALEALGHTAPAAVVVAGPAGLHFLRALRRATTVPILALDPYADDDRVLAAFAAGVDQFQAGSTGCDEVVARLQALLRRAAEGEGV